MPPRPLRTATFPPDPPPLLRALTLMQRQVLAVLNIARGPMTRTEIHEALARRGLVYAHVGSVSQSIAKTLPGQPSLLELGYVVENRYNIGSDGVIDVPRWQFGIKITPVGRSAFNTLVDIWRRKGEGDILPPVLETADVGDE